MSDTNQQPVKILVSCMCVPICPACGLPMKGELSTENRPYDVFNCITSECSNAEEWAWDACDPKTLPRRWLRMEDEQTMS